MKTTNRIVRIFLYEENFTNVKIIESLLLAKGFELFMLDKALQQATKGNLSVDLILVDLNEPGPSAQQTVQLLKSLCQVPIIALINIEYADQVSEIAALGIDQVIFKPYSVEELNIRLRFCFTRHQSPKLMKWDNTLLERRYHNRRKSQLQLESVMALSINPDTRKINIDDRTIRLSFKEFDLFCLLASEIGRVFSSKEILTQIWEDAGHATDSDVQQYISLLRKKIEADSRHPQWIQTHKGFGYSINEPEQ